MTSKISNLLTYHVCAALLFAVLLSGGNPASCAEEITVNPKAAKYMQVLIKRPVPGYVFDRFYNSWMDTSEIAELEKYLESKIKAEPDNSVWYLLSAFLGEKEGDEVKALTMYEKALEKSPASAQILYNKADLECSLLYFEKALSSLNKALEAKPADEVKIKILKLIGKVQVRDGKTTEAEKTWDSILAMAPDDVELQEDIIDMLASEGRFDKAIKICEKLSKSIKDNYKALMMQLRLGDIYNRAGKKSDALKCYKSALGKSGSDSWVEGEILSQIEHIFKVDDDMSGLEELLVELIKDSPKRVGLLKKRAQTLHALGRDEDSLKQFLEVVTITPGSKENKEQYIALLQKADKNKEAAEMLQQLVTQFPKDSELLIRLASIQNKLSNKDGATKTILAYLSKNETSEYAYTRCARLLSAYEAKDEAGKIYVKLVAKFPGSADAKEAYADYLFELDKKDEALKILVKLGEGAAPDMLMRIAMSLSNKQFNQQAYDLLSKYEKKDESYPILTMLCREALTLEKNEEALKLCLARIKVTESATEISSAINDASALLRPEEKCMEFIAKLEAKEELTVPETCLLSELHDRNSNFDKSLKVVNSALAKDANSVILLNQKYRLMSRARNWKEAEDALKQLVRAQPARAVVYIRNLVDVCQKQSNSKQALSWINEWKKRVPSSSQPYQVEARMHSNMDDSDQAIATLRKATLKFPEDEPLRQMLATQYLIAGKHDDAARIYWTLLENAKDLSQKLGFARQLAQLSQQTGSGEKLARHFEERAKANPKALFPLLALADIYRYQGNYEKRRHYMILATEKRSDDVSLLLEIVRIEEEEGQYEAMLATLEKAAKLDKTNRSKRKLLAYKLKYGDEDEATQYITDMLTQDKQSADDTESLIDSLIIARRYEMASDILKKATVKYPKNYRIKFLQAIVLEEMGMYLQAKKMYLELITIKEEIPGRGISNKVPANYNRRYSSYLSSFPPELQEIFMLQRLKYTAYSFRNPSRRVYTGFGMSTSTSAVALPPKVEELDDYVLVHLSDIMKRLGGNIDEEMIKSLQMSGVAYPDVKLHMFNNRRNPAVWKKLAEKYPKDLNVNFIVFQAQRGRSTPEVTKTTFNLLKDKYPELAMTVAVTWMRTSKVKDEELQKGLGDLLGKIKKPSARMVQQLCQVLAYSGRRGQKPIKNEVIDRIKVFILKHYETTRRANISNSWIFTYAAALMSQDEDYTNLVKLLNNEYRISTEKNAPRSPYMRYRNPNQNMLTGNLPPFPPKTITGFPAHLLQLFTTAGSNNVRQMMSSMGGKEFSKEKLGAKIEDIENNILKVVIAQFCEKTDEVKKLFEAKVFTESNKISELEFLASWHIENEQYNKAAKLLTRARYLPMTANERIKIDAIIIYLAIENESDKEILQAGRDAALRLRRARLARNDRMKLIGIMEDIGLKKEAEKLNTQMAKTVTPIRRSSHSSMNMNPSSKIQKLLRDGKKEEAGKVAARYFRSTARTILLPTLTHNNNSWQLRNMVQNIKNGNGQEAFLKCLKPKDDEKSTQKIIEYAYAHELLKNPAEAKKAYEKVIAIKPKDRVANLRVAMLYAKDDIDKAWKHFSITASANSDIAGNSLNMHMNSNDKIQDRITGAKLAAKLLESTKGKKYQQPSWALNIMSRLEQNFHENGKSIPHMHSRDMKKYALVVKKKEGEATDAKEKDTPESVMALLNAISSDGVLALKNAETVLADVSNKSAFTNNLIEREKAYIALINSALEIPQLCTQAFGKKLQFLKARDYPLDGMVDVAKKAISRTNSQTMQTSWYSSGNGKLVSPESPAELLVSTLCKTGKTKELDEFIATLTKDTQADAKQKLTHLKELYSCPPEKFIEVANKYAAETVGNFGTSTGIGAVIKARRVMDKKISLTEFVIGQIKKSPNMYFHGNQNGYIAEWASELKKSGKDEDFKDYLNKIREVVIGKPSKSNKKPVAITHNDPDFQKYYSYAQLLANMANDPKLTTEVLAHYLSISQIRTSPNLQHSMNSVLQNKGGDFDFVAKAGLFKDFAEFDPVFYGKGNSILKSIINKLRHNDNPRKEFLKKLEAIKPETFGTKLIATMLKNRDKPEAVYTMLAGYIEEMKKPENAEHTERFMKGFDTVAKQYFRFNGSASNKEAMAFNEFYKKSMSAGRLSELEDFLGRKDINGSSWQYTKDAAEMLKTILVSKPKKAEEILAHAAKVLKRSNNQQSINYNGVNYRPSAEEQILSNLMQNQPGIEGIKFALKQMQNKDKKWLQVRNNVTNSFYNYIENKLKKLLKKEKNNAKPEERIANRIAALKALDEEFAGAVPVRSSWLYRVTNNLQTSDRKKLIEELEKVEFKSFFGKALPMLLIMQVSQFEDNTTSTMNKKLYKFATNLLENDEYPADWKLTFFEELSSRCSSATEIPALAKIITKKLLASGIKNISNSYRMRRVINEFAKMPVDEEWKTTAEELTKQFFSVYMSAKNRNSLDSELTMSLFRIGLKADNNEVVEKLLNSTRANLRRQPVAYLLLIEEGKIELAAKHLTNDWKKIDTSFSNSHSFPISKEGLENGKKIIEAITDEDVKKIAEVLIARFLVKAEKPGHSPISQKRLKDEVAPKFAKWTFTSEKARLKTLMMLMRNDTHELLKPQIAKVCEAASIRSLANNRTPEGNKMRDLYNKYCQFLLADGEFEKFTAILKKGRTLTNDNSAKHFVSQIASSAQSVFSSSNNLSKVDFEKNMDKYIDMLKDAAFIIKSTNTHSYSLRDVNTCLIPIYFLAGKGDEAIKLYKDMSVQNKKRMKGSLNDYNGWRIFGQALKKYPKEKHKEVIAAVKAMLVCEELKNTLDSAQLIRYILLQNYFRNNKELKNSFESINEDVLKARIKAFKEKPEDKARKQAVIRQLESMNRRFEASLFSMNNSKRVATINDLGNLVRKMNNVMPETFKKNEAALKPLLDKTIKGESPTEIALKDSTTMYLGSFLITQNFSAKKMNDFDKQLDTIVASKKPNAGIVLRKILFYAARKYDYLGAKSPLASKPEVYLPPTMKLFASQKGISSYERKLFVAVLTAKAIHGGQKGLDEFFAALDLNMFGFSRPVSAKHLAGFINSMLANAPKEKRKEYLEGLKLLLKSKKAEKYLPSRNEFENELLSADEIIKEDDFAIEEAEVEKK